MCQGTHDRMRCLYLYVRIFICVCWCVCMCALVCACVSMCVHVWSIDCLTRLMRVGGTLYSLKMLSSSYSMLYVPSSLLHVITPGYHTPFSLKSPSTLSPSLYVLATRSSPTVVELFYMLSSRNDEERFCPVPHSPFLSREYNKYWEIHKSQAGLLSTWIQIFRQAGALVLSVNGSEIDQFRILFLRHHNLDHMCR